MGVSNVAKFGAGLLAGVFACAGAFAADTVKPAVIYDLGGKFDKSFNEGVYQRRDRSSPRRPASSSATSRSRTTRSASRCCASSPRTASARSSCRASPGRPRSTKIADEFPKTKFGIIDMVVDKPNVQSMVFKAEERLVPGRRDRREDVEDRQGRLRRRHGHSADQRRSAAATRRASSTSTDTDTVIANMTGTTPSAWNDPVKGGELAKAQIDQGADVVYRGGRRDRAGRAEGGGGRRQVRHRRRLRPGQSVPRQDADLDAEARRRRHLQFLQGRQGRHLEGAACRCSASRTTASATPRTSGTSRS